VIAIRADANSRIGMGHVMRCLALAEVLRARGEAVAFITDAAALVERHGFAVTERADNARWLVVDHYDLDATWERTQGVPVMAIDDVARTHACSVLLDQNPLDSDRYRGKVPADCTMLLGLSYALLRAEFRGQTPRRGPIESVMLAFGGADAPNETAKALAGLRDRGVHVRIVTGSLNPHLSVLAASGAELCIDADNMAALLAETDLVIGACGSAQWERFCAGVPSIVATLAPNQEPVAEALARRGLVRAVGRCTETTAEDYRAALDAAIAAPAALHAMADAGRTLVDGRGAERVADVLLGERR
jgi:UDP-2,4-diacetamido-2,4,6-trideoxy-beta-L-altropyranose hydrolase